VKRELLIFSLVSFATICVADDAQTPMPAAATAAQRAARPRQVAIGTNATPTGTTSAASSATGAPSNGTAANPAPTDPKFASEAKWVLAGYNSDEIVYTVFVTNQDPRIIRCTTEVKGFYFENGTKLSIQDRQITTVFPNQPTRVGYWMDMDQQSGASYSVKCHPV
jgi:hypothetical protein